MRRVGSVIGVDLEKLEEYKRLHAAVWPKVIDMIKECNCSIATESDKLPVCHFDNPGRSGIRCMGFGSRMAGKNPERIVRRNAACMACCRFVMQKVFINLRYATD